ncbi:MAG TPA: YncE family protein [Candidatus Acidoferrum sp.]|nr:YncE family protein [Candidatus Acidoferrum sp.]
MNRRMLFVVLLACIAAGSAWAQSTPKASLLALSKEESTVAIVDPATLKVVAKVPCGPDPHEVIASADGKLAFVSNYGGGKYNTISVIDLVAQKALPAIDLGVLHGAHGLAFAGGKLYFTAEMNKVIGTYDPVTQKVDWILGTGQNRTHMVEVSKDLGTIFTTNVSSATVSIIEKVSFPGGPGGGTRTDWTETVVPVGRGSEGFDISPDGKELWVANAQDGTISIVDIASKKVTETLDANVKGANRLKFTRDGKRVFVASLADGNVTVFDASTRKEMKRIKIGRGAAGILMQPDGARVFVAASPDNYVAVIDLKTLEVIGRIEPGANPDGLAWTVRQ